MKQPRLKGFGGVLARMLTSGLAIPLSALATGPLLARALAPEGRGAATAVLVPVFLMQPLAQLGLFEAVTFNVATNPGDWRAIAKAGYRLALLQGLWAATMLYLLAPSLLRNYPTLVTLLRSLALTLPIIYCQVVTRAVSQGRGRYDLVIREKWLWAAVRVVVMAALFVAGLLTVTSAAWVLWGSGVICALALIPILGGLGAPVGTHLPRRAYPQLLYEYGLRSWVGSLSSVLVLRLDQVILAVLVGGRELGLYAVAASLAEVPAQGLGALRDSVFARAAADQQSALVMRICRVTVALAVFGAAAAALLAPVVVPLLFGRDFRGAVAMADILLLGTPFAALAQVTAAGLQGAGRPGLVSVSQLSGLLLTLPLLITLVPHIGAQGAAIATSASYFLTGTMNMTFYSRVSKVTLFGCVALRREDVTDIRKIFSNRYNRESTSEAPADLNLSAGPSVPGSAA